MDIFKSPHIITLGLFVFLVWYRTKRKIKAGFNEYIDFYLQQNNLKLVAYRVLWFSSGNFKLPWYKIFRPIAPAGRYSSSMFIELIVRDDDNLQKNITCHLKSEGFYIVDAEFRD